MDVGDPASLAGKPVFGPHFSLDRPTAVVVLGDARSPAARRAIPSLNALFQSVDPDGAVVGVLGGPKRAAWDFVPRYHVLFPVLWDGDGALAATFGRPGLLGRWTLAAAIVRDGAVTWAWRARTPWDRPPVDTMSRALGE